MPGFRFLVWPGPDARFEGSQTRYGLSHAGLGEGMLRNRRLSRAIADAGMAGFLAKLEYKCAWYGAEFVKADRWFASSRLCAHCGWHNGDLSLSDRQWSCGSCGALNERDANAALNLETWPSSSFSVSGRGGRVSPAMPAVAREASMNLPAGAGLD